MSGPSALLFDLDGTLVDTAPDLGGAANRIRRDEGLAPLPLDELRPYVSQGARGLLRKALGLQTDDALRKHLGQRHIMDINDRCQLTFSAEFRNQPHDLTGSFGIKACCGFIHQQQLRVLNQSPGDPNSLTLSTREFIGSLVSHRLEANSFQQGKSLVDI